MEKKPIKDFDLGVFDGPHATPKEAGSGPIFLGIKNVRDGYLDFSEIRRISPKDFPKWTRRVTPQAGDIVFSYEATLHRYAIIPKNTSCCLGRRIGLIRPDPKLVNNKYLLYYFLSHEWRKVVEGYIISGATVDRIPIKDLPEFPVVLPSLSVQKRIASILSSYDDLIENNRRRIELLEQSARLLYREWFVRLRFPGHEHTRIKDGVPEGWGKKKIGELFTLKYGKPLKAENRIEGSFPVYGSSGIIGWHNKPIANGPGIIIGRKGNVGSVFYSHIDFFPIDTVYYIDTEFCDYYVYNHLQHMNFLNSDGAVPGLNRKYVHNLKFIIPDRKLRKQFNSIVSPIYEQMRLLEKYSQKLKQARDLLLPKLMSGEIAV